jgi:DIM1 family U5 snRNP protein
LLYACLSPELPPISLCVALRRLDLANDFAVGTSDQRRFLWLVQTAEKIKKFAVIYLVDIDEVPDFNTMYELYDECTTMFFYRNKHIMVDLGTGNNNKVSWAMNNKQEFIDLVTTVFLGAKKGRGLVISPKDYSTKYRY